MKKISLFLLLVLSINGFCQKISPVYPIPSKKQLEWQKMEYYGFIHFNMNTFTNVEWAKVKNHLSYLILNC